MSKMSCLCLTTKQRWMLLEVSLLLDQELNAYDEAMAKIIYRRREEANPVPQRRKIWVRPWLLNRPYYGQFRLLMDELRLDDVKAFKNFTRMDPDTFFNLLQRLEPRIKKEDTFFRKAICPAARLAIALRYFATGDSFMSLEYSWLVAHNTISKIVREVAEAVAEEYSEELLCPPKTSEGWKAIADRFAKRWNFEHALGAIDGKHVAMRCPKNSGSTYYNYKGFFSIIMLALVDADYRFIWLDVGINGACSDAQVWNQCELKLLTEKKKLGLPEPEPLPGREEPIPFFFIGDDAFALRTYMMKPYSIRHMSKEERIFNYRLSRARRIVENAFGILASRFGCLLTTMRLDPNTVTTVVIACCCLHNLLRNSKPNAVQGWVDEEDEDHNVVHGRWRQYGQLHDGEGETAKNTSKKDAKAVREYLKEYYSSPDGAVEWQDRMI